MINPYSRENAALLGGLASFLSKGQVGSVTLEDKMAPRCNFEGAKARGIFLPDASALPPGFTLDAIRGLMDHESAHARFTTSGWTGEPSEHDNGGLDRMYLNALEDARIERLMGQALPGAKANIAELNRVGWQRIRETITDASGFKKAERVPAEILALMAMCQKAQGLDPEKLLEGCGSTQDVQGAVAVAEELQPLAQAAINAPTTPGCWEQVQRILTAIQNPQPPQPKSGEGEGEEQEKQDQGKGQGKGQGQGQGGQGGGEGEDEGEGEGEEPQPKPQPQPKPSPAQEKAAERFKQKLAKAAACPADATLQTPTSIVEKMLGELDELGAGSATTGADAVNLDGIDLKLALKEPIYPVAPEVRKADQVTKLAQRIHVDPNAMGSLTTDDYQDLCQQMAPAIAAIRQMIRMRILAEGRTKIRPEMEEGEVDRRRLWALASGTSNRVFSEVHKGKSKRTAVSLLVDQSGSMSGERIIHARAAACAITEAVRGLPGVSVEVIGFTAGDRVRGITGDTSRELRLKHRIAKGFADRDCSPIVCLDDAGGATPTGESIRFAASRLMAERADRRILMVLTDGQPECLDGYQDATENIRRRIGGGDVAVADAIVACRVARKVGVDVIGIGIGTKVGGVFGEAHSVNNVLAESLAGVTLQELAKALTGKQSRK